MHGTVTSYYLLREHKAWVQYFESDACLLLDIQPQVNIQSYMSGPDRTKTHNGLGNESKNGLIKLKIFTPSGHGKSFHGCGLNIHASYSSRAWLAEHYWYTKSDMWQVGVVPRLLLRFTMAVWE